MDYPEASSYQYKISLTLYTLVRVARENNRLSFAKKRWLIQGPPWVQEKPVRSPLSSASRNKEKRPSAQRRNK